jgi:peptidoglycan/xylan/chitin deacetylase (PgdA/CDA1 family)
LLLAGPFDSRDICLTVDDGPHAHYTPALLDVLKRHAAQATFFVIGQEAQRHADLVRRMVSEGHVVANHSYSHRLPAETSTRQLLEEARCTEDCLAELVGIRPRLFRPPYGAATPAALWQLWRTGHGVVLWNSDPKDFACRDADELRAWFRRRPLRGGDLVLLHDTCPHTVAVLAELIGAARQQGLRFTTLSRWMGRAYFAPQERSLADGRKDFHTHD